MCSITPYNEDAVEQIMEQNPDLVLIAMDSSPDALMTGNLVDSIKKKKPLAAIALLSREMLDIAQGRLSKF